MSILRKVRDRLVDKWDKLSNRKKLTITLSLTLVAGIGLGVTLAG